MTERLRALSPQQWRVVLAMGAVYVIWGSTYLAIRFALETLPPFGLAGARFVISGLLAYGWARWRGAPRPTGRNWRAAAIIGALMMVAGNGGVVWAEQHLDSGLAALLIATEPLWIVVLFWLRPKGTRPTLQVAAGLALGLAGMAFLVRPGGGAAPVGALAVLFASFCWAVGSLYGRRAPLPTSPILASGMQMLSGGAMLLFISLLAGEPARVDLSQVSLRSLLAVAYLIVGGLIAFTAYGWLLRVASPVMVSTYAYVNPVVAVLLGWAFAGEPLTGGMLGAAAIILTGVAMITLNPGRPTRPQPEDEPVEDERAAA
ncbi:MAG: EamA family transporter [Acidobacteriota bacterium]